jgi:hypothetical protein
MGGNGGLLEFDDNTVKDLANGQNMVAKFEELERWPARAKPDTSICVNEGRVRRGDFVGVKYFKVLFIY